MVGYRDMDFSKCISIFISHVVLPEISGIVIFERCMCAG